MTWGLQQRDLPILNPYHQALKTGLEDYSNIAQAAYLKPQMQANILSKAAYATYAPYQSIAKVLSDPQVFAQIAQDPNQMKRIVGMFSNIPTDPMQSINGNQNSKEPSIWDNLKEKLGLSKPESPTEQHSNLSAQDIMNLQNQKPGEEVKIGGNVASNPTSPTNFTTMTPQDIQQQAFARAYPTSQIATDLKARQAAQIAQATADVGQQNKLWTDRLHKEGETVDTTNKSVVTLDAMKSLYPKLSELEKGIKFGIPVGKGPAVSNAAQTFDQLATTQYTNNLRALQTGHITNTDFQIGETLKPGRWMNEKAFNEMIDYNKALALRAKQRQKFFSEAKNKKMTIQDADTQWADFIDKNPLFDSQKLTLKMENVKKSPFDASSNEENIPSSKPINNQYGNVKTIEEGGKKYIHINGKWMTA